MGCANTTYPTAAGTNSMSTVRTPSTTWRRNRPLARSMNEEANSGCMAVISDTANTPWGNKKNVVLANV